MGIRITKQLGYALTDFEYDRDNWKVLDPRVDADLFNREDGIYDMVEAFSEWALSDPERAEAYMVEEMGLSSTDAMLARMSLSEVEPGNYHHSVLTLAPEFGSPKVLLFQPLTYKEWTRYGNIIDSYEADLLGPEERYETRVHDLLDKGLTGIYPYAGFMYRYPDRDTPEQFLTPEEELKRDPLEYEGVGLRAGKMSERLYNVMLLPEAVETSSNPEHTRAFQEHLRADWGCRIPRQILLFAHWSNIFTEFNTVYRLRPVLYTYWT